MPVFDVLIGFATMIGQLLCVFVVGVVGNVVLLAFLMVACWVLCAKRRQYYYYYYYYDDDGGGVYKNYFHILTFFTFFTFFTCRLRKKCTLFININNRLEVCWVVVFYRRK